MSRDIQHLRTTAIAKAIEEYTQAGRTRTEMVLFRGERIPLKVVRVNPVTLLLNSNNSRLRAQLEDIPEGHRVFQDPSSVDSQQILASLLRRTSEYKKLKDELRAYGQVNPGIVSRDGLLINGNTRVVALRDLGIDGADVAVLPLDATSEDYFEVETSLQLTKFTHQDYTFTNKLLMMKAHLDRGIDPINLAKLMGWTKNKIAKVEQHMRMLQMINEVRRLSENTLKYEFFDSKQQHLLDLDEKYQSLVKSGKIQEAEDIKWTRLYAIFLGVNKDQVRVMNATFISDEVKKRAADESSLIEHLDSYMNQEDDPLSEILNESEDDEETSPINIRQMVKDLLTSPEVRTESGDLSPDLPEVYSDMEKVLRLGANAQIEEQNETNYGAMLIDRIIDATIKMEDNVKTFADRAAVGSFDQKLLEAELGKLVAVIDDLKVVSTAYFSAQKQ